MDIWMDMDMRIAGIRHMERGRGSETQGQNLWKRERWVYERESVCVCMSRR